MQTDSQADIKQTGDRKTATKERSCKIVIQLDEQPESETDKHTYIANRQSSKR